VFGEWQFLSADEGLKKKRVSTLHADQIGWNRGRTTSRPYGIESCHKGGRFI
jgi:hypothetical protein